MNSCSGGLLSQFSADTIVYPYPLVSTADFLIQNEKHEQQLRPSHSTQLPLTVALPRVEASHFNILHLILLIRSAQYIGWKA